MPDVFAYDSIPYPLRVQVVHLLEKTLGDNEAYHDRYGSPQVATLYSVLVQALRHEYGVFQLPGSKPYEIERGGARTELLGFLLNVEDAERALDVIELCFRAIDRTTRDSRYLGKDGADGRATAAIAELNVRFKQHGIGFQFVERELIRVDSQYLHAEAVLPALELLHDAQYAGAEQEFLKAHEHYRHGREKEALSECLKALESTMRTIADKRGWIYPSNATSSALIQLCIDNDLIPSFWLAHFTALRSTLESGVPTGRNRLGGHGQGSTIVEVPPHIVGYVLHLAAAGIVFLVESEKNLT